MGTYRVAVRASNSCGATVRKFDLVVTGRPILRVSPSWVSVVMRAGDRVPRTGMVLVSSDWPGLAYDVPVSDQKWLNVRSQSGRTPAQGSALAGDPISLTISAGDFAPGTYESKLRVCAWQSANCPEISITVTVLAR